MLSDSYSAPNVDASLPSPLTLTLTHTRCCFFVDVVSTPAESQASSMQSYILPTLYKIGCLSDFSIFFFFFFVDPEMKANVHIAKTIQPYTHMTEYVGCLVSTFPNDTSNRWTHMLTVWLGKKTVW